MQKRVEIVEGHDNSSYFWIFPVVSVDECGAFTQCSSEEISIEEDDVYAFLYFFFDRYFNPLLEENLKRECNQYSKNGVEFEQHLDENYYLFSTLERMLCTIEEYATLLQEDYDNPNLDKLKHDFSLFYWMDDAWKGLSEEQAKQLNQQRHVELATDFYSRFVARMRRMLLNAKDCHLICIIGP